MKQHQSEYDFSAYPKEHLRYLAANKKVIGKMKEELNKVLMQDIAGLRAKYIVCSMGKCR